MPSCPISSHLSWREWVVMSFGCGVGRRWEEKGMLLGYRSRRVYWICYSAYRSSKYDTDHSLIKRGGMRRCTRRLLIRRILRIFPARLDFCQKDKRTLVTANCWCGREHSYALKLWSRVLRPAIWRAGECSEGFGIRCQITMTLSFIRSWGLVAGLRNNECQAIPHVISSQQGSMCKFWWSKFFASKFRPEGR